MADRTSRDRWARDIEDGSLTNEYLITMAWLDACVNLGFLTPEERDKAVAEHMRMATAQKLRVSHPETFKTFMSTVPARQRLGVL